MLLLYIWFLILFVKYDQFLDNFIVTFPAFSQWVKPVAGLFLYSYRGIIYHYGILLQTNTIL